MNREELKNRALLERISTLTTSYENQDAERRIDITVLTQQKEEAEKRVTELEEENQRLRDELVQANTTTTDDE